jgi:serine/threonine-protein kinase
MTDQIIKFIRRKDLEFIQELGQGACGRTVLLYDRVIDEQFVCKKYSPLNETMRAELFRKFVQEIKLLHLLNHPIVVRVFHYYIYREELAGSILMEYVVGADIEEYLLKRPEQINQVFLQVIEGFAHLEKNKILHRDIRPMNLMISNEGVVKIIDFGFGKQAIVQKDYGKSITLNWWCEPPTEFASDIYDYCTEVYFVGKLFEKIIIDNQIEQFAYKSLLTSMCKGKPEDRIESFSIVRNGILAGKFLDIEFSESEIDYYRIFAEELSEVTSKIEQSTKYVDDPDDIQRRLEGCYKKVMLEQRVPCNSVVLQCFLSGAYYYSNRNFIQVSSIRRFIELLRSCSREKKNIVIGNLHTRLDSVTRYEEKVEFASDIPF